MAQEKLEYILNNTRTELMNVGMYADQEIIGSSKIFRSEYPYIFRSMYDRIDNILYKANIEAYMDGSIRVFSETLGSLSPIMRGTWKAAKLQIFEKAKERFLSMSVPDQLNVIIGRRKKIYLQEGPIRLEVYKFHKILYFPFGDMKFDKAHSIIHEAFKYLDYNYENPMIEHLCDGIPVGDNHILTQENVEIFSTIANASFVVPYKGSLYSIYAEADSYYRRQRAFQFVLKDTKIYDGDTAIFEKLMEFYSMTKG